jgi:hypothetical protein
LKTFQTAGHYPRPFLCSIHLFGSFSPPRVQPILFSFFIAPICFWAPTFCLSTPVLCLGLSSPGTLFPSMIFYYH